MLSFFRFWNWWNKHKGEPFIIGMRVRRLLKTSYSGRKQGQRSSCQGPDSVLGFEGHVIPVTTALLLQRKRSHATQHIDYRAWLCSSVTWQKHPTKPWIERLQI